MTLFFLLYFWFIIPYDKYCYRRDIMEQLRAQEQMQIIQEQAAQQMAVSSIEEIADVDWALNHMPNYEVSTPEQLAGIVYAVNNGMCSNYVTISLTNDIDLAGLNWEPMGNNDIAFNGYINGNGHAIKNMTIPDYHQYYASFIGYTCDCTIQDISFLDADVNGGMVAGIVGGQIIGRTVWSNVYVSGQIHTTASNIGAILGWQAHMSLVDCSSDVLVNDQPYPYASYQQMVRATTPVDETFVLTESDGIIVRDDHDGYTNLMWHVDVNGIEVMEAGSSDNTMDIHNRIYANEGDQCTVYMVAWTGQTYTRVSNIIQLEY